MAISSDQLQLLFERQQQRFKKSQLSVLDNLRIRLLNHPCFGDVTEVDKLISNLHTELENDCRTYKRVDETLRESLISGNVNELVAVIHDAPSDPEMSFTETCLVVRSDLIIPETPSTNTGFPSSQKNDVLLNTHEIIEVLAHKETENKSSIIMKTIALNGSHHSTTKVSDECTYWGPLVVLPDMSYLNDSFF
ncbi:unnamed protein product [Schistosoma mattheei]|uniref:Uncharacterized protein n=1 Tax=Schistosoma mattheei TaxID=31246 RepID=A0A183NTC4_9TREM|nr:unnamed protein product [Schistosoma mattheei]